MLWVWMFGVDLERARAVFNEFGRDANVRLCGIHLHIGSPIYSPQPYVLAIEKILVFIKDLRDNGFEINTLDRSAACNKRRLSRYHTESHWPT